MKKVPNCIWKGCSWEKSLRQEVIETLEEYGGWWQVGRIADWLDADAEEVRKVYDELEAEGLMERKTK